MSDTNSIPYIGSFVLETLTTGMYEASENALREYVQNAFDSIRLASQLGLLSLDKGRVDVKLSDDTLSIEDNGVGITAASAWGTLTSIGASKKDRKKDAGFRGIGRLAGIAFCDKLTFCTKAVEEDQETTISFDCTILRNGMDPDTGGGMRLVDLLGKAITKEVVEGKPLDSHYMKVSLTGLSEAPAIFHDADAVSAYLAETSPVGFDPKWTSSKTILDHARSAGWGIESVALFVTGPNDEVTQIHKMYKSAYALRGGTTQTISEFRYYGTSAERWWGWVGLTDVPAIVPDSRVHGIRVRVKNIQVGGTAIFDELFGEYSSSSVRFNEWYVGELHIHPSLLIPNARRDGFEDSEEWDALKATLLKDICSPLAERARKASEDKQKSFATIEKKVSSLATKVARLANNANSDTRYNLLAENAKVRSTISDALVDATPPVKLQLKAQLDRLEVARHKLAQEPQIDKAAIRKEIIGELLDKVYLVLESQLDPELFGKLKHALKSRIS